MVKNMVSYRDHMDETLGQNTPLKNSSQNKKL
jgi:hypothetical protein